MFKSAFYIQKLEAGTSYKPEWSVGGRNKKSTGQVLGGYINRQAPNTVPMNCVLVGKNDLPADTYWIETMGVFDEQPTYIPVEAFKVGEQYYIQMAYYKVVDANQSPAAEYDAGDNFQLFGYFPQNFNYF